MFTDQSDWLMISDIGYHLIGSRDLFLSRKAKHTFSGYAVSQLKRINTHYRWIKNRPLSPPTRVEYGLPERTLIPRDQLMAAEAAIKKKIESWDVDLEAVDSAARIGIQNKIAESLAEMQLTEEGKWSKAALAIGYDSNFIELLDRERAYRSRQSEWEKYQNWKVTRNAVRAEIEARHGYDCKNAMHLVRLLKMCREIITDGKVLVKRPDAEELLSIRNGAWTYDQLIEWAEREDKELSELVKTSPLPHAPDRAQLDALCVDLVSRDHGL